MTERPAPPAPLPPGSVLLHVGPHKTGSTALQAALWARRAELPSYGVAYPGEWRRAVRPGRALIGWAPSGRTPPPVAVWDRFARRVRGRTGEVVCVSTEDLARVDDPAVAGKAVADLGGEAVTVVAVARAYHRVLPSHWQERAKGYLVSGFDDWLRQMLLGDQDHHSVRSLWRGHDVTSLLSVWLPHLDPDRFVLVVTDDSDRRLLPHTFEALLGLPAELLRPPEEHGNASLGTASVELLQRLNRLAQDRGRDLDAHVRRVRADVVRALQDGGPWPGEQPLPALPEWAVPLVEERTEQRLAAIADSGVRVVGDPAALRLPAGYRPATPDELAPPDELSMDAAVAVVDALLERLLEQAAPTSEPPDDAPLP